MNETETFFPLAFNTPLFMQINSLYLENEFLPSCKRVASFHVVIIIIT
jgi:hypothetical protein